MKFLLNLFKKEEKKQRKLKHRQPQEISEEQFRIALSFARREMSLGDVADRLNLTNRNLSYIFITNAFRQLIDKGILIESNGVTKNELDVCVLDDDKSTNIKRPVGRPRIPRPVEEPKTKREYIPRKKVLNTERFTTLMEEKGLQFENLSKNAQLKIQKYNGIKQRLRFMPESKLKAINSMIKRANELESSIFKSVFYFTPEKYQRKLDYLKKCGFIKDKSKVDTVDESMFQKKKIALWKPEAESVLGKIKISKSPSKFMRRKYPNLIEYVRAYKPEYVK